MLRPLMLFPIGILFIWLTGAGCGSKKAAATAETAVAAVAPKRLPDSLISQNPAAGTPTEVAHESASGDVPALHEPFEERKTVAPGLVIVIKSIQQPSTAVIRDPLDIKVTFSILQAGKVIYRDTADGMTYDFSERREIAKQYPIWIPTGQTNGELLVASDNRPFKEVARRYFIRNNRIGKIDTLPVFNGPAKDQDNDGKREFAGALSYSETWADEHGKRYITYDPTLYYEVRPTGLVLDSVLTTQKIKAEYGVFKGFQFVGQLKILVDNLPKSSPKRH